MRVHIQRHCDLAMAQNLLHDFGMHFHSKKNSCRTVSEVVEAHVRQANTYQESPKNFPQGARAKVVALSVGKHQPFINPGTTDLAPLSFLLRPMTCENINNKDREFNR